MGRLFRSYLFLAGISSRSDGPAVAPGEGPRQYSGISQSIESAGAPTLTGQPTLAVRRPTACAACHSVGTRTWLVYQYHAP